MAALDLRRDSDDFLPGIILGKEIAKKLNVNKDDMIQLVSSRSVRGQNGHAPSVKWFRVIGLFDSGLYEYDVSLAYISLKDAQQVMQIGDAVTGIELRLKDIYKAQDIAQQVVKDLGFPFWATDWMRMNRTMFAALRLQKTVMFIILALIILVAAFNIAGALIMMVMEKTKDIAILKVMGATDRTIGRIFVLKGMIIGLTGTLIGVICGFIICVLLKQYHFIELDPQIYPFTTLPVRINILDTLLIACSALVICFMATLYPSRQAAKLNPVQAIHEG
jgi:lipoprotein-releasing system permease protein